MSSGLLSNKDSSYKRAPGICHFSKSVHTLCGEGVMLGRMTDFVLPQAGDEVAIMWSVVCVGVSWFSGARCHYECNFL